MKLTADTITDEQIRELMNPEHSPIDTDRQPWVAMAALGDTAACYAIGLTKEQARARCAEIIHARETRRCSKCGALCDHAWWDGVNCPWCLNARAEGKS